MKKLILGLLTALLMSAGLVGLTTTASSAACPYSGCVGTRVTVSDSHVSRTIVRITAKVDAIGSNKTPKGSFELKVFKNGNKKLEKTHGVGDGKTTFNVKFGPGTYTYIVKYDKKQDSAFFEDSASGKFTIKRN